jgi:hypothetical protein
MAAEISQFEKDNKLSILTFSQRNKLHYLFLANPLEINTTGATPPAIRKHQWSTA